MEKVYLDAESNKWIVKDLSDFYSFKCLNTHENKEVSRILTWTKDNIREEEIKIEYNIKTDVRLYIVEIEDIKVQFLLNYGDNGKFPLNPLYSQEVSEFMKEKGYIFLGETEVNNN